MPPGLFAFKVYCLHLFNGVGTLELLNCRNLLRVGNTIPAINILNIFAEEDEFVVVGIAVLPDPVQHCLRLLGNIRIICIYTVDYFCICRTAFPPDLFPYRPAVIPCFGFHVYRPVRDPSRLFIIVPDRLLDIRVVSIRLPGCFNTEQKSFIHLCLPEYPGSRRHPH